MHFTGALDSVVVKRFPNYCKKIKNGFQNRLSLYAGQKYCRMLPVVIKTILSIFEWPFYTGFTVQWKEL